MLEVETIAHVGPEVIQGFDRQSDSEISVRVAFMGSVK